jgi:hypothetical protein
MLKVVVVNSHLILATLLNQILTVLSKLVIISVVRFEDALKGLQVEVFKAFEITVLHHDL